MGCRDGSPYAVVVGTAHGIEVYSCGCTAPGVDDERRKELWEEVTGLTWDKRIPYRGMGQLL